MTDIAATLLSPVILVFVPGEAAAFARSDLAMSLAISFPFTIIVGLPLHARMAEWRP